MGQKPKTYKQLSVTPYTDTGDSTPIKQKPYRLCYNQKQEVYKQIQEMLNNRIIEHSVSPWASPVFLVNKPEKNNVSMY